MKFKDILKQDLCVGCGLCEAFGNKMEYNHRGYLRPKDQTFDSDLNKKLIEKICPGYLTYYKADCNIQENKTKNAIWGEFISLKKAYSTNENIRFGGSSGGVITSLLAFAIEHKIVDSVIVTSSDASNPIYNRTYLTNDFTKIIDSKSSRYSPSSPLTVIKELESSDKKVILVGKPCDITAYKNLEKIRPKLKSNVIYTISFLCAGVPSVLGTKKLIETFGVELQDVTSLKYRGDGCPGNFTVKTQDKKKYQISYSDSWGTVLNKYLQKRCKICPDGTGEAADIACGDIWEETNNRPIFNDNEGYSLVFIRNLVGENLYKNALKEDAINELENVNISKLNTVQPYQVNRRKYLFARFLGIVLSFKKTPNYDFSRFSKFVILSPKIFMGTLIKTYLKSRRSQL